jgi:membrane associated rhomboid family serine protease
VSFLSGENQSVAWEAHVGGFLAGLLLFSLFDPVDPAPVVEDKPTLH